MTPTRSNPTRTTVSVLLGFALVLLILLTRSVSRDLIAASLMAIIIVPVVAACQEIFPYLHTRVFRASPILSLPRQKWNQKNEPIIPCSYIH